MRTVLTKKEIKQYNQEVHPGYKLSDDDLHNLDESEMDDFLKWKFKKDFPRQYGYSDSATRVIKKIENNLGLPKNHTFVINQLDENCHEVQFIEIKAK